MVYHDFFTNEAYLDIRRKAGLVVAALCGLCLVPITSLFVVQCGNCLLGKTTHERFAREEKKVGSTQKSQRVHNLDSESGPSLSDSASMLIDANENDFAFFSGTTQTVGDLSRDRIRIQKRTCCFGLFLHREVTVEDQDDIDLPRSG